MRRLVLLACLLGHAAAFQKGSSQLRAVKPGGSVLGGLRKVEDKTSPFREWKDDLASHLGVQGKKRGNDLEVLLNDELLHQPPEKVAPDTGTASFVVNVAGDRGNVYHNTKCPLSQDLETPFPAKLSVCTEFSGSSCCSVQEEAEIATILKNEYEVVYGQCPGCLDNMRKLLCSIHCSPDQQKIARPYEGKKVAQVNLCASFCDMLYSSCKDTAFAGRYVGGAESFCMPQLDTLSDIRVKLIQPDDDRMCLDPKGSWQCLPGIVTKSKEASSSDTTWLWWLLALLALLLLLALIAFFFVRNRARAGAIAAALSRRNTKMLPTYAFVRGARIGGQPFCNGYYVQPPEGQGSEDDDEEAPQPAPVPFWLWCSPARSQKEMFDNYAQWCDEHMYRLVESVPLACGPEFQVEGPATVQCWLDDVSNLNKHYLNNTRWSSSSTKMELYGQMYVTDSNDSLTMSKADSFCRFKGGMRNFGWSQKADPEEGKAEWDEATAKDTDITFEAAKIEDAFFRVVIRDKMCGERRKQRCGFNKELIGVTEKLPVCNLTESAGRGYQRTGRLNPTTKESILEVRIEREKMAPYFAFNEDDEIDEQEFQKIVMYMNLRLFIEQRGWKLQQALGDADDYQNQFKHPITKSFRTGGWQKFDGLSKDTPPDGELVQMLKPLCDVIYEPPTPKEKCTLVLAVFVTRSGSPGHYTWALSNNEFTEDGNTTTKKKMKKSFMLNKCCALFKDYDMDHRDSESTVYDKERCKIYSSLLGSAAQGQVTLNWGPAGQQPFGKTFFIKNENDILALYEDEKCKGKPIEKLKLTFGKHNQYEVMNIKEAKTANNSKELQGGPESVDSAHL